MKTFVCLALAGVATAITQNDIKFMDFLAAHGKDYNTIEEFNFRAALFAKKDAALAKINANPENTFSVAHNMFSDRTKEEMKKMRGLIPEENPTLNMEQLRGLINEEDDGLVRGTTYGYSFPSSKDWRSIGGVTPVK